MKSSTLSIAQVFLLTTLGLIGQYSPVEAQGIIAPGHLYIKTEITNAGGIRNLIDSSTKEVVGTSTFNAQRLPTGTKMAVERIRLGIALVESNNTTATPAGQNYLNKASAVEARFRAANFIINRAGKEIMRVPVSNFLTGDSWEGMIGRDDAYFPDELRVLQGDDKLEFQLEFPDDVAWTANKRIFVSVELFGPKIQL